MQIISVIGRIKFVEFLSGVNLQTRIPDLQTENTSADLNEHQELLAECMAESLHCSPETITTLLMGHQFSSVQFSSVAQSCPTLCNPMNRSTPGLPVHHQLPEFTQTCVHRVGDAIQPSHPLSSPSPPVPNPSQHQGLFQ